MFFAGSVIAQDTPIKEYSSDNRLMNNVVTAGVLDNGMVVHTWEWNDTAKALDAKYRASAEDGGFMPAGLIAQDVQAVYPDAVIEDTNGYLTIDLSVLADQDELIANIVMEGDASAVNKKKKRRKKRDKPGGHDLRFAEQLLDDLEKMMTRVEG